MHFEKHKSLEKALHNLKAIFDAIPNGKQMKVILIDWVVHNSTFFLIK